MQHVGLTVNNVFAKFHEILIKIIKVLGPYMSKTICLLETGSSGTGSWQSLILMALLLFTNKL